jgi:hypothetical protein
MLVEVGHLQAKFTGHFSLLGFLERLLVAKVGDIQITGLQLQLSLLRGRGCAELVGKFGMSNTGSVQ